MTPARYAALVACAASNVRRLETRSWARSLWRRKGYRRAELRKTAEASELNNRRKKTQASPAWHSCCLTNARPRPNWAGMWLYARRIHREASGFLVARFRRSEGSYYYSVRKRTIGSGVCTTVHFVPSGFVGASSFGISKPLHGRFQSFRLLPAFDVFISFSSAVIMLHHDIRRP